MANRGACVNTKHLHNEWINTLIGRPSPRRPRGGELVWYKETDKNQPKSNQWGLGITWSRWKHHPWWSQKNPSSIQMCQFWGTVLHAGQQTIKKQTEIDLCGHFLHSLYCIKFVKFVNWNPCQNSLGICFINTVCLSTSAIYKVQLSRWKASNRQF